MTLQRRVIVLVSLLVLAAPSAQAQSRDAAAARAAFRRAEVHYSVGEFERALGSYRRAYKYNPLPAFLFNIGQCLRKLGRCHQALFYYKQYLIKQPDAPNRADVERLIELCEVATDRQPGAASTRPAREQRRPLPAATSQPTPAMQPPAGAGAADRADGGSQSARRRIVLWSGVGLSSALLLTSAITGAIALSMSNEYKDPATTRPRQDELRESGTSLRTAHYLTLGLGGAAAAATALYYWRSASRGERASVAAVPCRDGGQFVISGAF